jgi:hypothetical protein
MKNYLLYRGAVYRNINASGDSELFRYLQRLDPSIDDDLEWDYDYDVTTTKTTEEVVQELHSIIDASEFEPNYYPAFTPGATATIATSNGTVLLRAEGWSYTCSEAVCTVTPDKPKGEAQLLKAAREKLAGWVSEAQRDGYAVVGKQALGSNWITFLIGTKVVTR